jgi:hypothetical protein
MELDFYKKYPLDKLTIYDFTFYRADGQTGYSNQWFEIK